MSGCSNGVLSTKLPLSYMNGWESIKMNLLEQQTNIATDYICRALSLTGLLPLQELLESSQELRQALSQCLQLHLSDGISQKELDGSMSTLLTELHKHSSILWELSLPLSIQLTTSLLNPKSELNSKLTYKTMLTNPSPQPSTSQQDRISEMMRLRASLKPFQSMRQGLEDSPAIQTEAGEDSPLPQSLTKRPSNTKESFTKSTTPVMEESAESKDKPWHLP